MNTILSTIPTPASALLLPQALVNPPYDPITAEEVIAHVPAEHLPLINYPRYDPALDIISVEVMIPSGVRRLYEWTPGSAASETEVIEVYIPLLDQSLQSSHTSHVLNVNAEPFVPSAAFSLSHY